MERRVLLVVLALLFGSPAAAQRGVKSDGQPFDWSGKILPGARLRIIDVHGDVRVTAASGERAVVHADVRSRGRHSGQLSFDVVPDGINVTICARWADGPPCTAHGIDSDQDDEGESASADFTVELPRSARLEASTGNGAVDVAAGTDVTASSGNGAVRVVGATGSVHASSGNGDVTVDGAGGPVLASTGNGSVRAYTTIGPVNASSGNGSIDVRMQSLGARSDMAFSTGNGEVTVAVPGSFAADLDADTGHGSIRSDFQMQVSGRISSSSHLHAVIAGGGPRVHLSSGNGDLVIRKL